MTVKEGSLEEVNEAVHPAARSHSYLSLRATYTVGKWTLYSHHVSNPSLQGAWLGLGSAWRSWVSASEYLLDLFCGKVDWASPTTTVAPGENYLQT